jgi:hypothetical protein
VKHPERRTRPEATVLPVHFEDRSGPVFERLCFAYPRRIGGPPMPVAGAAARRGVQPADRQSPQIARSPMRPLTLLLTVSLLAACSKSPSPNPSAASTNTTVTGTVLERLDAPPYSYLRLKTEKGEVWVAVPMATVESGGKVTITHGAALKNFAAPRIGKKFDAVTFGTLERR